jgi:hypothetical protein
MLKDISGEVEEEKGEKILRRKIWQKGRRSLV